MERARWLPRLSPVRGPCGPSVPGAVEDRVRGEGAPVRDVGEGRHKVVFAGECSEYLRAGVGLVRERGGGQFEFVRGHGSYREHFAADEVLAHRLPRVERLERDNQPTDGQVLGDVVERRMV